MMDPTANDFMAFFPNPDQNPGFPSRLQPSFKFPQAQGYSFTHGATLPSQSHGFYRSEYTQPMHTTGNNVSSAGIPSMPVAFDSVKPTIVKQNPNMAKLGDTMGRNALPLNAQWHWTPSPNVPQRSNWPDVHPQQYPALYQPSVSHHDQSTTVIGTQSNLSDLHLPFYTAPNFAFSIAGPSVNDVTDQLEQSAAQVLAESRRPSVISLSSLQLDSPEDSSEEKGSPRSTKSNTPDRDNFPHGSPKQSSKSSQSASQDQPKKKSPKMHTCHICQRSFPRPSGLQVHLNSHNGLKPFTCEFPSCDRKFTVRSNARRHLRTHGVTSVSSDSKKEGQSQIAVVQDAPNPASSTTNDTDNGPKVLRWIPHSLSGNAATGGDDGRHGRHLSVDLSASDSASYPTYQELSAYWPS